MATSPQQTTANQHRMASPRSPASPSLMSSPDASRAAILGAASNGWSPQRQHRRDFVGSEEMTPSSSSSPGKSPSRTFDPSALRSHGLVSNSIFKQAPSRGSPASAVAPSSPTRASGMGRGSPGPARMMGVGLGIGVGSSQKPDGPMSSSGSGFTPRRASRDELTASTSRGLDAENAHQSALPPRKSKGYEVLTKSGYVTNSPFKSNSGNPQSPEQTRPLSLSASGARNAARSPERPSTPPNMYQHDVAAQSPSTPRAYTNARSPTSPMDAQSPANRSLLTSNRLHGPRQMSQTSPTKESATEHPETRERRKTVTFDEEPEIQEFDRESSFDANSLRSAESNASLSKPADQYLAAEDDAEQVYWQSQPQRLMVVNGSPMGSSSNASSPQLSDNGRLADTHSVSSTDSRDLSSSGTEASEMEPVSPERAARSFAADSSYDKTWATAADETAGATTLADKDASFMSLGGLHRVDSMVDELLQADILSNHPMSAQNTGASHEEPDHHQMMGNQGVPEGLLLAPLQERASRDSERQSSPEFEQPKRRGDRSRQLPRLSTHLREESDEHRAREEAAVEGQLLSPGHAATEKSSALPNLPNWSPLIMDEAPLPGQNNDLSTPGSPVAPLKEVPMQSSPRREGGRPHISRDAVLERVAREKRALAEAEELQRQAGQSADVGDTSLPVAQGNWEGTFKSRPSAPASRSGAALDGPPPPTGQRPAPGPRPHPEASSYEAKPAPSPSPVKGQDVDVSPLERLGEQMAAATVVPDGPNHQPPPASPWFDTSVSSFQATRSQTEVQTGSGTGRAERPTHLVLPPASAETDAPPSPALSTRSGMGPAPPAITPDQHAEQIIARRRSKNKGRRKRSMSTGDAGVLEARRARGVAAAEAGSNEAEDALAASPITEEGTDLADEDLAQDRASIQADLNSSKLMLDHTVQKAIDGGFGNGLCRDISRIFRDGDSPYKVNDRGTFAAAEEKVSHSRQAGDVDAGKAWRKLRRPSDINEYAEEMRAYRANENPKKAAGKVFVMVDSFQPSNLAVPAVPCNFYCILDNGLHVVKTGTSSLSSTISPIGQEFELIQHKNLEFSLTLFVQPEEPRPVSPTKKDKTGSVTKSFVSRLLRSPKKDKSFAAQQAAEPMNPLAAYTNREGAFGRVNLVFESVAAKCLGKCLVLDLPVHGVADPMSSISGHASINSRRHADFSRNLDRTRGTLRLKLFYLPPMPSVPRKLMPENLKACIQGMEDAKWHMAAPRLSGTLTQQGGDCRTWRRRPVTAQGTSLICYNDVTKRPTVKIDLSKAKSIDENWDPYDPELVKSDARVEGGKMVSRASMMNRFNADEEPDESYHVPNSFRVTFADGEVISFFADTKAECKEWVSTMKNMAHARRPPNPMWAQVALDIIRSVEGGSKSSKAVAPRAQQQNSASRQGHPPNASRQNAANGGGPVTGRLTAGKTMPATVQEEPLQTPSPAAQSMVANLSTASAPAQIRRKQVPSVHSVEPQEDASTRPSQGMTTPAGVAGPAVMASSRLPSSSGSGAAYMAAGSPRVRGPSHQPSASLSNPWSTPVQQQRFGASAVNRPTMPLRPQSELFTPVRKQSAMISQRPRP